MQRSVRTYLVLLLGVILAWLCLQEENLQALTGSNGPILLGIAALYLVSHVLRMIRLGLLTLDERKMAPSLIAAHTLTAFPSSFLPFKIGEVLRLAAFLKVYDYRRKALAVWMAERFGDLIILSAFIFGLYLFNVDVPSSTKAALAVFVLATVIGLMGLFSIAKVSIYLNRHLVLTSHSHRGLVLLRISHMLRGLEQDISRSVKGRVSGLLLLSVLIWAAEIIALSFFIYRVEPAAHGFASMFTAGLLANLPGSGIAESAGYGLLQAFALVALTLLFLAGIFLVGRLRHLGSQHD